MPLEVNNVAFVILVTGPEEVIETNFVQGCSRSVSRDVPADATLQAVGPNYHGHSVPAHQTLDAPLNLCAAGKRRLLLNAYGIEVRRVGLVGQSDAIALGMN